MYEGKYKTIIFYFSDVWQVVTVYKEIGGGKIKQVFHGNLRIDIHADPVAYMLDEKDISMFTNYVIYILREAIKWLEFWEENTVY